jgi:predicted permease
VGQAIELLASRLRYSLRSLRGHPTFAVATLLTLALGIGSTTAVFSVVNSVLLNPLPYPKPDALVGIVTAAPGAPNPNGRNRGIPNLPESASMFVTYADENRSLESIGIWFAFASTITGLAEPEQVVTITVSRGTLETLGVPPSLGRSFAEGDYRPGAPETVVLADGYWKRRFAAAPSIVGRTITIDSQPREVIGVMPPGFRVVGAEPEIILPLHVDRSQLFLVPFSFQMLARLKPGVSIAQANADLARLSGVWMDSWSMPPGLGAGSRAFESWHILSAARPLKDDVVGTAGSVLWVLMGTIGIVLLIACANVANLMLVRVEGRHQELAVRAALGAGSWRIVRELLAESLWLGLIGGVLGLGLAQAGLRLLVSSGPETLPRLHEISIDGHVLGFALLVSLLSGLFFGLVPAWRHAGRRPSVSLAGARTASDSRDRHRARNTLVVVQVALALVLLVSAGLMIRTFLALRAVEPGFSRPEQLQTVRITIPPSVATNPDKVAGIYKTLFDAMAAIPGVQSVALSNAMPMEGMLPRPILSSRSPLRAERDTDVEAQTRPLRWFKFVSPGYFKTTGTKLLAGREYTWLDLERLLPVVMVSRSLAVEQWGSPEAALGQRVRSAPASTWRVVVGVVEDVRENGPSEVSPPIAYWPSRAGGLYQPDTDVPRSVAFVLRTPLAGTEGLLNVIRQRVSSVNPNLPLALVRTMQQVYDESMARTSFTLVMLATAGIMALIIAVIGIYGVITYLVAQRAREVAIRMALGAQAGQLRRMFLRYGLTLTSVGVATGLGVAAALMRVMRSLLFEVRPVDPLTYASVPVVLLAVALLACYLPARRASQMDPAATLKAE